MKIVVLDGATLNPGDNPWTDLQALADVAIYERSSADEILDRSTGADILITNKAPLSRTVIESLPTLRLIGVTATGYNVVDVAAANARGIVVCNVPDYGTNTVAQYVLALLLELCHHVGSHAHAVQAGEWTSSADWTFWRTPQIELHSKTMGIVGYGRIGRRVAELASAFGMRILYNSRTPSADAPHSFRSLTEIFAEADIISLHCGLIADNAGMVNAALLARMKPSAFLINTARGGLIHEADLAAALHAGTLAGAALDVLSIEPPAAANPLLSAPNCLITPHMAWASLEARQRILRTTVDNIRAYLAGNAVNVVT